MNRFLFLIICIFLSKFIESQNWDSIRGGKFNHLIERVLFDPVHNKLLASSKFITKVGDLEARGICSWDGTSWDTLAGGINTHNKTINPFSAQGMALSCIPYNGKLLVGGMFNSIGGINATALALWDGIQWDSLPVRAFQFNKESPQILGFCEFENKLYICGTFDTIAGQSANGLATWDGNNFTPVILPHGNNHMNIVDIAVYKNELYVTGSGFTIGPLNDGRDIYKYDGTNWNSTTGTGLLGGYSGAGDLTVYDNCLFACGHFTKSDGNIADHIMKWDGSTWQDVQLGNPSWYINIDKMQVYHNKLWVVGGMNSVAGSPADNVAVFDGHSWCVPKDSLDNVTRTLTVYKDTLFIGGSFWSINGDSSIAYLAKLKDEHLFRDCIPTSVNELNYLDRAIKCFPNPTSNKIMIELENERLEINKLILTNSLGQPIYTLTKPLRKQELDLNFLSSGIYFLQLNINFELKTIKIIKL